MCSCREIMSEKTLARGYSYVFFLHLSLLENLQEFLKKVTHGKKEQIFIKIARWLLLYQLPHWILQYYSSSGKHSEAGFSL